jgi:hypothetical protein
MMKSRLILAATMAVVALAGALGGARWARSQGTFPEGAFVVGADDTRWVVGNGVRYRISFVTDDAGALPGLRESSTVVSTVAEAQAALAGGPAPASGGAPAPRPAANPAESLVGQSVRACNYGVDFDISVARVEWTKSVIGNTAPGNGMWIVAFIDVTNASNKAEALTTRPLQLRDGRGREYNVREYPPDPVDLFRAYMVHAAFQNFEPGITEQSVVTFQVPDDAGPLTLVGKRDFC